METANGFVVLARGQLPPGSAGTRRTLELMRQVALAGARNMTVRERALEVLRLAGVRANDAVNAVRVLFEWVRDRVRFVPDPVGVELLQTPSRMVRVRAGDCDDKAMLLVAMLRSIGIDAGLSFRAIATNPLRRGEYSHVFVMASVRGRRIALDPTWPGTMLGWQAPSSIRPMELSA